MAAGGARKKPAVSVSVPAKCKGIRSALLAAQGFPEAVLQMLAGNVESILGTCKEERHKTQEQAAEMVQTVLKAVEAALEANVSEAEGKVNSLSGEKDTRSATLESATAAVAAKKGASKAAKEAEAEAAAGLKSAKSACEAAKDAQQNGDADLEAADGKKKRLEAFLGGPFEEMKKGAVDPKQESGAEILKIGKEYKLDASLLQSLPSAIGKAPAERGSFDELCLTQVEEEFKGHIQTLSATLSEGEPAKAARAVDVASAETALADAEKKKTAAVEAVASAKREEKEAEEALKAAKQAVKDFVPQLKEAGGALDDAKAELEQLKESALGPFEELMAWSNVPPPEPEPEAAPPAAEPAAAEATA